MVAHHPGIMLRLRRKSYADRTVCTAAPAAPAMVVSAATAAAPETLGGEMACGAPMATEKGRATVAPGTSARSASPRRALNVALFVVGFAPRNSTVNFMAYDPVIGPGAGAPLSRLPSAAANPVTRPAGSVVTVGPLGPRISTGMGPTSGLAVAAG